MKVNWETNRGKKKNENLPTSHTDLKPKIWFGN